MIGRAIAVFVFGGVLAGLSGPAFARAPSVAEMPTLKLLLERAAAAAAAARAEEIEAARDLKMERIQEFGAGKLPGSAWKEMVEIIENDKEDAKYRHAAVDAIRTFFKDVKSGPLDAEKRKIGQQLYDDLNNSSTEVRTWVSLIFRDFWPAAYSRSQYDPTKSVSERREALRTLSRLIFGR